MAEHSHRTMQRHTDVVVVGGSAAGLAAALQLARQRRSVVVVDAGEPRNAPAAHVHGYLGHEAIAPSQLVRTAREEVRSHGGEVLDGRVASVHRADGTGFRVELVGGHSVVARRVLAATGLVDLLPDIEGVAEHWGRDVVHCPFCHGYEWRDRRLALVVAHPSGLHPATLWRHLTDRLTLVLHDGVTADHDEVRALRDAGVGIAPGPVRRLLTDDEGRVTGLETTAGEVVPADAVVIGSRFEVRTRPFAPLGLRTVAHPSGLGEVVATDETGQTAVPGLYAAGNVTDPGLQVLPSAADGSRVGAMISFSLAAEDAATTGRPSANQADWDDRYSGEHVWSGNPNPTLVDEAGPLPVGRALDVGAGEGGDAVWLSEQGWDVTASDVSLRALERIAAEAERRQVHVTGLHADATTLHPFERGAFDLVTAHYASIPRAADGRSARNLLDAVAPGGTLLVVGHDLEPMRRAVDTTVESRAFDPDAFVRTDDVAAELRRADGWQLQVHERRPRATDAASADPHVHDVVLRARRLGAA